VKLKKCHLISAIWVFFGQALSSPKTSVILLKNANKSCKLLIKNVGSCRQIGETGYHQGSEESGGDSLEIVRPLENGDVCGKIFW
jgi:hypothetical protein